VTVFCKRSTWTGCIMFKLSLPPHSNKYLITLIHFTLINNCNFPIFYSYHINGSLLKRVFGIKDLGIHYSPSLDFNHHINVNTCKALKVLGLIIRNTKMFSSVHCLRRLYLSLVCPGRDTFRPKTYPSLFGRFTFRPKKYYLLIINNDYKSILCRKNN